MGFCVAALVACKSGAPPEADLEIARTIANDALAKIERSLADARALRPHSPEAAFDSCAVAASTFARLRASADAMLATKLEELCGYELPIAELHAAIASLDDEAAACSKAASVAAARGALERAGRFDAAATQLVARYDARCAK